MASLVPLQSYRELSIKEKMLKAADEEGDLGMMFKTASCFESGDEEKGFEKDLKEAKRRFTWCAAAGHPYACYSLAVIYFNEFKDKNGELAKLEKENKKVEAIALVPKVQHIREMFTRYAKQGSTLGYPKCAYLMALHFFTLFKSAVETSAPPVTQSKYREKAAKNFARALFLQEQAVSPSDRLANEQHQNAMGMYEKSGKLPYDFPKVPRLKVKNDLQLEEEVEILRRRHLVLKQEVQSLSLEKQSLEEGLQMQLQMHEVQRQNEIWKVELDQKDEELKEYQMGLDTETSRIHKDILKMEEKERQFKERVGSSAKQEKGGLEQAQLELQREREEIDNERQALEDAMLALQSAEADLVRKKMELGDAKDQFALQRQQSEADQKLSEETFHKKLEARKKLLQEERKFFELNKADFENSRKQIEADLVLTKKKLEETEETIETGRVKVERERQQLEAERSKLEQDIAQAEMQLRYGQNEVEKVKQLLRDRIQALKADKGKKAERIEKLKTDYEAIKAEKLKLENEYATLKKEHDAITSHAQMITIQDDRRKVLRKQHKKLQVETNGLTFKTRRVAEAERTLEKVKKELKEAQQTATTYKETLATFERFNKEGLFIPLLALGVKKDNKKVVQNLMQQGYNVNQQDAEGNSCLQLALMQKNREMVYLLLESTSLDFFVVNLKGMLAIEVAIQQMPKDIDLLIKLGEAVSFFTLQVVQRDILKEAYYTVTNQHLFDPAGMQSLGKEGVYPLVGNEIEPRRILRAALFIQAACMKAFKSCNLSTQEHQMELGIFARKLLCARLQATTSHLLFEEGFIRTALDSLKDKWRVHERTPKWDDFLKAFMGFEKSLEEKIKAAGTHADIPAMEARVFPWLDFLQEITNWRNAIKIHIEKKEMDVDKLEKATKKHFDFNKKMMEQFKIFDLFQDTDKLRADFEKHYVEKEKEIKAGEGRSVTAVNEEVSKLKRLAEQKRKLLDEQIELYRRGSQLRRALSNPQLPSPASAPLASPSQRPVSQSPFSLKLPPPPPAFGRGSKTSPGGQAPSIEPTSFPPPPSPAAPFTEPVPAGLKKYLQANPSSDEQSYFVSRMVAKFEKKFKDVQVDENAQTPLIFSSRIGKLRDKFRLSWDQIDTIVSQASGEIAKRHLPSKYIHSRLINVINELKFTKYMRTKGWAELGEMKAIQAPGDGNCFLWSCILAQAIAKSSNPSEIFSSLQSFSSSHSSYVALQQVQERLRQALVNAFSQKCLDPKEIDFKKYFCIYFLNNLRLKLQMSDGEAENIMASGQPTKEMLDVYVDLIAKNGTWNGEFEAELVAQILKRPIVILNVSNQLRTIAGTQFFAEANLEKITGAESVDPLIVRHSGLHYDALFYGI